MGELTTVSSSYGSGEHAGSAAVLTDRFEKRTGSHHSSLPSQDDLERMVQFQLEHLQAFGCRVPDEMKERLSDMLDHASSVPPDVHFVRYGKGTSASPRVS